MTSLRLLVVEDDRALGPLLLRMFRAHGHDAELAADGQRGLHLALTRAYDVLVIDRGLPAIEGLDLLARLRRSGTTAPALILTALGTLADRVEGLDRGADDYLVKPFEVEELMARVRVLARRNAQPERALDIGSACFDPLSRAVTRADGTVVTLSGRESDLLRLLAQNTSRVFTRDEIVTRVFPESTTATLADTYVHYLRRKLGTDAVRTVRGVGYRLGAL